MKQLLDPNPVSHSPSICPRTTLCLPWNAFPHPPMSVSKPLCCLGMVNVTHPSPCPHGGIGKPVHSHVPASIPQEQCQPKQRLGLCSECCKLTNLPHLYNLCDMEVKSHEEQGPVRLLGLEVGKSFSCLVGFFVFVPLKWLQRHRRLCCVHV